MHSGIYSNIADLLSFRFQIKRKKLTNQQTLISTKAGYHQAIRKGRGMSFTEVREYQAGDEVRHIDWKVSARTQKTHTKVFTEELEKPIICLVEQSSKIFFGSQVRFKTVQAINIAAIIGWITLNHGDKFGALVFNNWQASWHKPKQNHQALLQFLHSSLDLQTEVKSPLEETKQSWEQQLELVKKQISSGNRIFLIGDFLQQSTKFFQNLAHFRKKNQLTLIHVFDPLDKKIPKAGLLSFSNGLSKFRLDTNLTSQQKNYQISYQKNWQYLKTECGKFHIPVIEIDATQNPITELINQRLIN